MHCGVLSIILCLHSVLTSSITLSPPCVPCQKMPSVLSKRSFFMVLGPKSHILAHSFSLRAMAINDSDTFTYLCLRQTVHLAGFKLQAFSCAVGSSLHSIQFFSFHIGWVTLSLAYLMGNSQVNRRFQQNLYREFHSGFPCLILHTVGISSHFPATIEDACQQNSLKLEAFTGKFLSSKSALSSSVGLLFIILHGFR